MEDGVAACGVTTGGHTGGVHFVGIATTDRLTPTKAIAMSLTVARLEVVASWLRVARASPPKMVGLWTPSSSVVVDGTAWIVDNCTRGAWSVCSCSGPTGWPMGSFMVDPLREAICGPPIAQTSSQDASGLCPILDGSPCLASTYVQAGVARADISSLPGPIVGHIAGRAVGSSTLSRERTGHHARAQHGRRLPLVLGTSSSGSLDIKTHNTNILAVNFCVVYGSEGLAVSIRADAGIPRGLAPALSHKTSTVRCGSSLDAITKYAWEMPRSPIVLLTSNGEKGGTISLPC
mmetsp:Transcript_37736/g.80645  ORF Transcript_37736/g.80645 Transcript_37736/m.80645 type:complete len:291 (-) Transcript_37736:791-1663(-)